nr:MAG TPA: hypothetical protein [Caudoviricetes sp.]
MIKASYPKNNSPCSSGYFESLGIVTIFVVSF